MIKVCQYLADKADDKSFDDIIAGWTGLFNKDTPPYSHSEIAFSDGWCFSATLRDKYKGTRFAKTETVMRNRERWGMYVKDVSNAEEQAMRRRAAFINGRPYAKVGLVLSFLLPFGWLGTWVAKIRNRWYCSMCVYYVLTRKRIRISPRRLTQWILKDGFVLE